MEPTNHEMRELLAHLEEQFEDDEDTEELPSEYAGLLRAQYMRRANWGSTTVRKLLRDRQEARVGRDEAIEAAARWRREALAWRRWLIYLVASLSAVLVGWLTS